MKDAIRRRLTQIPDLPGIYLMRGHGGEVLYVGKSTSLSNRVRSYFSSPDDLSPRIRMMAEKVESIDFIVTDSEMEALTAEYSLIKKHRPYFNVRFRDDKRYPYLEVTWGEAFPRLRTVRRPQGAGSRFFGPFPNTNSLRQTLDLARKIFRVRLCKTDIRAGRARPCLNHQLGLCQAPCAGLIGQEEYRLSVEALCRFIQGHSRPIIRKLRQDMKKEAAGLNFEACARIKALLADVERTIQRQKAVFTKDVDQDCIAFSASAESACVFLLQVREGRLSGERHFILRLPVECAEGEVLASFVQQYYGETDFIPEKIFLSSPLEEQDLIARWLSLRRGGKVHLKVPSRGVSRELTALALKNARLRLGERPVLEALESLRDDLRLPSLPWRIEAYDLSHLGGDHATGSMVVFQGGEPLKSGYRRFRIKEADTRDDFSMMAEVLRRRLKNTELPRPDLILLDGGRGHISAVLRVMREVRVAFPLAALAKEEEEVFIPGLKLPVRVQPAAKKLLQFLRDEAHRFARLYHHHLQKKRLPEKKS